MQTKKQLEAYYRVNWKKVLEVEIAEEKEKLN